MSAVFIIAGIIDAFSVVYSHSNSFPFILGTPFTTIYTISAPSTNTVIRADKHTSISRNNENGFLLYAFNLSPNDCTFIGTISDVLLCFIILLASIIYAPFFFTTENIKFIKRMNTNKTTPVAIRASL